MEFAIYGGFLLNLFTVVLAKNAGYCSNWKLSGGFGWYEGIVEVKYENSSWVNICADSFTESNAKDVCQQLLSNNGSLVDIIHRYSSNVYKAAEQRLNILYTDCSSNGNGAKHRDACRVASLCCYDHSAQEDCSFNWTSTFKFPKKVLNPRKHHMPYNQLTSVLLTENISRSWTASSLQGHLCGNITSTGGNLTDVANNCTSTCEMTSELFFVLFNDTYKTCCLKKDSYQFRQTDECAVTKLRVIDGNRTINSTTFCLAAEVFNGSLYVSVEDCGTMLQAFSVSSDMIIKPTTNSTKTQSTSVTTHNHTKDAGKATGITKSPSDMKGSIKMVIIVVASCVSFLIMVCVVSTIVIVWKFKQRGGNREQQRPNSVTNRAYATDGFHHLHQDDEEEYTLISDMEIDNGSTEPYKPPVPDRGEKVSDSMVKDKEINEVELITLAEYSIPSDNVRLGNNISETTDYCMTTYDDPIRLKLKKKDQDKCNSDNIGTCACDKRVSQSNSRGILDRNSQNSQMSSSNRNSATTEGSVTTNNTTTLSKVMHSNDTATEFKNKADIKQNEFNITDVKQGRVVSEICFSLKTKETETKDVEIDSDKTVNDDSDYEETGIIDGNFKTKCPSNNLFEEHVCLHCLKPEHLKKLGIKIISDDMYEKSKDLQRSFSDPSSKKYYNIVKVGEEPTENAEETSEQTGETEPNDNEKGKISMAETDEDRIAELDVARRKKANVNARRCSVCHTVYDRLGDKGQNAWANCTDNVYDQFGNFKHFKHRRQISGKRMNST